MLIGDGVSHDDDGVFLGIFDGLGFKLAAWVSDRWLGWWVWWPLLAPTGLCMARCVWPLLIGVCGSIDGLVVCVYLSGFVDGLCLFVCVVMGLDRLIGAS